MSTRSGQLSGLATLGQEFESLKGLFTRVVEYAREFVGSDEAALFTVAGSNSLHLAARLRRTVLVDDVHQSPAHREAYFSPSAKQIRSVLAVPLLNNAGHVVATLQVSRCDASSAETEDQPGLFSTDDAHVLESAATFTQMAMHSMSVAMQAEQVQHVNDALLQLTKELAADVDVASLAATVTSRLKWLLHAATVNFFLVDKSSESLVWLQPMSEPGAPEAIVAPVKFPMKHGLVGHAAASGEVLVMEKAFRHPKFDYTIDQCNVIPPGVDSSGSPQPGSSGLRDLHGTAAESRIPSTPPATSRSTSTDASIAAPLGHSRSGSLSMMRSSSSSELNGAGFAIQQGAPLSLSLSTAPQTAKSRRKSAHANALGAADKPAAALPTGVNVLSCLVVPVKDSEGEVVAVIQAVNKTLAGGGGASAATAGHQQSRRTHDGTHTETKEAAVSEGKTLRQRFTEPDLFSTIPRPGSSPLQAKHAQYSTPTNSTSSPLQGGRRRMRSTTETSEVILVTSTSSNRCAMASPRRPRFASTAAFSGSGIEGSGASGSSSPHAANALLPSSPAVDDILPGIPAPRESSPAVRVQHTASTQCNRSASLGSESSLLESDVYGVSPYTHSGTGIGLPPPGSDSPVGQFDVGFDDRAERTASAVSAQPALRALSAGDTDGVVGAWGVLPATEHLRNAVIPFTASDASVAEGVSASVGVCLQKALMFEAISQAQRQTAAMLDIVKATSEERDIAQLMRRMVAAVFQALEADRVTLFLADHAAKELWVLVSRGDVDGVRVPMGKGIVGHVATTGRMVAVRDAYRSELFNPEVDRSTGYHTKSVLCMPVVDDRGHVVAVVEALNKLSPFEKARRAATRGKEFFRLDSPDTMQQRAPGSTRSLSRQNSMGSSVPRARSGDSSAAPLQRFRVLSPAHSGRGKARQLTRGRSATASDLTSTMRGDLLLPSSLSNDPDGQGGGAASALHAVRSPMASPLPSPSGSSGGSSLLGDGPHSRPRARRMSGGGGGAGMSRRTSFSERGSPSPPASPVMQALQRLVPPGGTRLGSSLHATVASASVSSGQRPGAVSPPEPPPIDTEMGAPAQISLPSRPPASPAHSRSEGASGGGAAPPSSPFANLSVHTGGERSPPGRMRKQSSAPALVPKGGMGRIVSPPAPPPRPEDHTPTTTASTSAGSLKAHVEKSSAFVEFSPSDIQVLEACCAEMVQSLAQHSLRMLAQKRSRDSGLAGKLAPLPDPSPLHGGGGARPKRMSRTSSQGSLLSDGDSALRSPHHGSQDSGGRGGGAPLLDVSGERGLGFVDSAVAERLGSGPMSQSQMHNAMSSFLSSYMTSVEGEVTGASAGTPAPTTPAFRPTSRRASVANVRSFRHAHKRSNTMQPATSAALSSVAPGGVGGGFAPDPERETTGHSNGSESSSFLKRSVSARARGDGAGGMALSRVGSSASMGKLSTTSVSSASSEQSAPGGGKYGLAHSHSHRTIATASSFTAASVGVVEEEAEAPAAACRKAGVSWNDTATHGTGILADHANGEDAAARVRSLAGLDRDGSAEGGSAAAEVDVGGGQLTSPTTGMRVTLDGARREARRPPPSPLDFARTATPASTETGPLTVPGPVGKFDFASPRAATEDTGSPADDELEAAARYGSGNASVTLQHHDVDDVHAFNPATDVCARGSPGHIGSPEDARRGSSGGGGSSPVAVGRGPPNSALSHVSEGDGSDEPTYIDGDAHAADAPSALQHVPGVPVTVQPLAQGAAGAAAQQLEQTGTKEVDTPEEGVMGAYIPDALTSERSQLMLLPVPTMQAVHAATKADIPEDALERRIERVLNQGSTVRFPVPGAPAPPVVSAWCDAVRQGNLPEIDTWAFRPWDVPMDLMPVLFAQMVFRLNLFTELPGLRMGVVASFAAATLAGYNSANEFHNMCHGLHVAQATYLILRETGAFTALPPDEVLTLMVAALGHDVDHTGTNSDFLIKGGSNLATRYNDASVLENYHCASLSAILAVEEFAVFDFASPQRQKRLRKLMLSSIMCTDMSRHLEVVNSIKKLRGPLTHPSVQPVTADIVLETGEVVFEPGTTAQCPHVMEVLGGAGGADGGADGAVLLSAPDGPASGSSSSGDSGVRERQLTREDFVCGDEQQRTDLCGILLHCADISGQVTPWSTAENWSDCVIAEFKAQAAMEIELDLEATAFMHSLQRPEGAGTLQKGFCDFVLHDLFSAMGDLYPALRFRVQQLQANAKRHGDIADQARKAATEAGAAAEG